MELTAADRIWNRAAMESGGDHPGEGDQALAALLLAHGMVMTGGVEHALESLSPEEMEAAIAGYRYFALAEVARLLEDAALQKMDLEDADQRYDQLVPDDGVLVEQFQVIYARSGNAFAPA